MGVLDWGRGVWTYDNVWYWGTASGWVDGVPFGFNLGYGFSDRSSASENVLIYDGKVHKLDGVTFCIPEDFNGNRLYTEPWQILSSNERLEGDFIPIFGRFTGRAVLDDGTELDIKDLICGVEVVHNKY